MNSHIINLSCSINFIQSSSIKLPSLLYKPIYNNNINNNHLKLMMTTTPHASSSAVALHTIDKLEPLVFRMEAQLKRRQLCIGTSLVAFPTLYEGVLAKSARAEEDKAGDQQNDDSVIGSIKSLFDPNEKTKSGKVLPKTYLKSAREVVKTLRESVKEDRKDMAKFRRTADAAKESIRDYLTNWRGQQSVAKEESYIELEKALRSLANFYAKAGPSAPLTDEVMSEILQDLDIAEEYL